MPCRVLMLMLIHTHAHTTSCHCNIRLSHLFPSLSCFGTDLCRCGGEAAAGDIRVWQADGENMLCIVPQNISSFLTFFSLLLDLFWFFVLLLLRAECACVLFPQPTNAYLIATIFDGQWNSRNE